MIDSRQQVKHVAFALKCMARQCWEQGLAAQAMLEIGDNESLILMARDCVVRQNPDGRLCDVEGTPAIVDPAICVEPVVAAGKMLKDSTFSEAAQRNIDYLLNKAPKTSDGAVFQLEGGKEIWADSLGMGPHVLIMNNRIEEGLKMYKSVKSRLFDHKLGLYRHKWDEQKSEFSRSCFWGVGNGWALVGLMRMAQSLVAIDRELCNDISRDYQALIDAMIPFQRDDGLFYDFLNDKTSFVETEAAEMFAYSIYKMVYIGLLPEAYLEYADLARSGVYNKIDKRGLIYDCAGSPTFEYPGTSVEGQAHFIMMEAAAEAFNANKVLPLKQASPSLDNHS